MTAGGSVQRPRRHRWRVRYLQSVAQRPPELGYLDLEHVAGLGLEPVRKAERRCAEEMGVHVARTAEQRVLEVVALQVLDTVRHVALARQERLLPRRRAAPTDARRATDIGGQ